MAAGGFREFVAGETLDEEKINDFLMQGVLVFAGTAARGSAITSPVEGQFSFLKDSDGVEFYDGSNWVPFSTTTEFDFLVVAGGGAGGSGGNNAGAGGGGAGGYRCSVTGELSGGSAVAEPKQLLEAGVSYTVTVGAGGAGAADLPGAAGNISRFAAIVSTFGGSGERNRTVSVSGGPGASGGGAGSSNSGVNMAGGAGIVGQGFAGGLGTIDGRFHGGGGGGAQSVGGNADPSGNAGNGGAGISSSITGSSVGRGGGGGGADAGVGGSPGTASDGGGAGGDVAVGTAGTANTGGGGGGSAGASSNAGANGGSGVVIIKYPSSVTLTIGGGLTSSTTTSGSFKITTFTAGTDVISF